MKINLTSFDVNNCKTSQLITSGKMFLSQISTSPFGQASWKSTWPQAKFTVTDEWGDIHCTWMVKMWTVLIMIVVDDNQGFISSEGIVAIMNSHDSGTAKVVIARNSHAHEDLRFSSTTVPHVAISFDYSCLCTFYKCIWIPSGVICKLTIGVHNNSPMRKLHLNFHTNLASLAMDTNLNVMHSIT